MSEELLQQIKNAIDITFDDEDVDNKILGIIEDGIVHLRSLFGCEDSDEIDWTEPGLKRRLLKNYCLYELNDVGEKFTDAYRSEIFQVRKQYEVAQWREANSNSTTTE